MESGSVHGMMGVTGNEWLDVVTKAFVSLYMIGMAYQRSVRI